MRRGFDVFSGHHAPARRTAYPPRYYMYDPSEMPNLHVPLPFQPPPAWRKVGNGAPTRGMLLTGDATERRLFSYPQLQRCWTMTKPSHMYETVVEWMWRYFKVDLNKPEHAVASLLLTHVLYENLEALEALVEEAATGDTPIQLDAPLFPRFRMHRLLTVACRFGRGRSIRWLHAKTGFPKQLPFDLLGVEKSAKSTGVRAHIMEFVGLLTTAPLNQIQARIETWSRSVQETKEGDDRKTEANGCCNRQNNPNLVRDFIDTKYWGEPLLKVMIRLDRPDCLRYLFEHGNSREIHNPLIYFYLAECLDRARVLECLEETFPDIDLRPVLRRVLSRSPKSSRQVFSWFLQRADVASYFKIRGLLVPTGSTHEAFYLAGFKKQSFLGKIARYSFYDRVMKERTIRGYSQPQRTLDMKNAGLGDSGCVLLAWVLTTVGLHIDILDISGKQRFGIVGYTAIVHGLLAMETQPQEVLLPPLPVGRQQHILTCCLANDDGTNKRQPCLIPSLVTTTLWALAEDILKHSRISAVDCLVAATNPNHALIGLKHQIRKNVTDYAPPVLPPELYRQLHDIATIN